MTGGETMVFWWGRGQVFFFSLFFGCSVVTGIRLGKQSTGISNTSPPQFPSISIQCGSC